MATDSLQIFGTSYTGVTGIKATDSSNGTKTYIRPQGTKSITANGTGIDVTEYASVDVSVTGPTLYYSAYLNTTHTSYSVTYNGNTYNTANNSFSFAASDTITVNLSARTNCAVYLNNSLVYSTSTGVLETTVTLPASNVTISFTQVNTLSNRVDINSTSATSVTLNSNGTYAVAGYNSAVVNVSGSSPNLQAKTNISPTTSSQTITADNDYDGLSSVQINAMPTGSATGPSSLSGSSAAISTGTNTITLTKTGVTTTPTVSAGYVSAATASTATVALTASVTTKAAATITPGTSDQTIASGTYLTGTQTIGGDANLVAGNIISGKTIFGVSGSVVIQHYYTGTGTPSSSTGVNGDIYLKTE